MSVMESGALARVVKTHVAGDRTVHALKTFIVVEYVSAEESDDGTAYYLGDADGGTNNIEADADKVEQVMSATEMANPRIPAPDCILGAISDALCGMSEDGWESDETYRSSSSVDVSCMTDEGMRFNFTVNLVSVEKVQS